MKTIHSIYVTMIACVASATAATAAVRYVNVDSASPTPPYSDWATAANVIQDAIDVAMAGDEIVVTNGVYETGGLGIDGVGSNRVAVTKAITVRSVNGPTVTMIRGDQASNDTLNNVRCAYLTNNAVLVGFTLTNGATATAPPPFMRLSTGGGVTCESVSSILSNCVLTGNSAFLGGGGAYSGTLNNCALIGNSRGGAYGSTLNNCLVMCNSNSATSGGGAYGGMLNNCTVVSNFAQGSGGGAATATLNNCLITGNSAGGEGGGAAGGSLINCTIVGNSAGSGGGVSPAYVCNWWDCPFCSEWDYCFTNWSLLYNCIVYDNTARHGANYWGEALFNYSCTTPIPTNGIGNISAEPQLASTSHLSANSPCRGAGHPAYASGVDVDGEPWANPPSMGCDEFIPGGDTGPLSVTVQASFTNVARGFEVVLSAQVMGHASANRWEFGDGTVLSNRLAATHSWQAPGDYTVVVRAFNQSYPAGVTATQLVHVEEGIYYVAASSSNPVAPYTSWATAAATIQDAVDGAAVGGLVLVSNGVYQTGGRVVNGNLTNRVAVTKPLTLRGVNGPQATVIGGYQVPGTTNGDAAIRCVHLADGAKLTGFTLTNGSTRSSGGEWYELSGGGAWCQSLSAVVSNCLLQGNSAMYGGAVSGGTLDHCTLTGNVAFQYGGAAYSATLNNCTVAGNSAGIGGGAYEGMLNNCNVTGNSAHYGGGASLGTLNNCTLVGNSAGEGGGGVTGFAGYVCAEGPCVLPKATLNNCIVYNNTAPGGTNYDQRCLLTSSCTTPLPTSGSGNISADPQLASATHISANSPCRGAGNPAYASGVDIDGEPWANPPSIGCDEFHPGGDTGPLSVAVQASFTNVATAFEVAFSAQIIGHASANRWEFGDGMVLSNRLYATHAWLVPGDYRVVLRAYNQSNPGGVSAALTIHVFDQPVSYVALSSNPVAPYNSWATAANTIQDAVDGAAAGGLVLVSNGVYQTGARAVSGALSNRVAVMKPLTLRSANGPAVTVIRGYKMPGTDLSTNAVRCVYLTSGATLMGFTLTAGATWDYPGTYVESSGGGVWCESATALVSNCVLTSNAARFGGGAFGGTLIDCTFLTNSAQYGGGANSTILDHCTLVGNSGGFAGGVESGTLSNCTLVGNMAHWFGGGTFACSLTDCVISGNRSWLGGGVSGGTLNNCLVSGNSASEGGGVYSATVSNCVLTGNSAALRGGGAHYSTLNNCLLTGNSASYGGGTSVGTLNNCTLVGNSAMSEGGGAYGTDQCFESLCKVTLNNCILYNNTAPVGANYSYQALKGEFLQYCCTTPLAAKGIGNIANAPLFMDAASGNFRLQSNSPCINAGRNADARDGSDLDGNPRIVGGTVDIGAYEFQSPQSALSYAWLQQYGLPTDGSADLTDPDGDGHNNWQEWRAWTDPTNSSSALRLLTPLVSTNGLLVRWQSVSGQNYFLERRTNLGALSGFAPFASNIVGQADTTVFADTNALETGPFFYRVRVNE
jgi:hypothetical protein